MITINDIAIDAALSEEHTLDSEVTAFPVEDGADMTDHVRTLPRAVTIEGIVSDTPLGPAAVARAGVNALIADGLIEPTTASADALAALKAIRDARQPVTITTSLGLYENMVMESLSIPRDAKTGAALRFSASFREVVIVSNKRTSVRVAVPRGKGKRKVGNRASQAFEGPPDYWCVEDKAVFVKPEDVAKARATNSTKRPDVWTDYREVNADELVRQGWSVLGASSPYTELVEICARKEQIGYDSAANGGRGALVRRTSDGKLVPLNEDEAHAYNRDAAEKADITNAVDPVNAKDLKSNQHVRYIDRPFHPTSSGYVDNNGNPVIVNPNTNKSVPLPLAPWWSRR